MRERTKVTDTHSNRHTKKDKANSLSDKYRR